MRGGITLSEVHTLNLPSLEWSVYTSCESWVKKCSDIRLVTTRFIELVNTNIH